MTQLLCKPHIFTRSSQKSVAHFLVIFLLSAVIGSAQQPDPYPKAKSKRPVLEKEASAAECLQIMTEAGAPLPTSIDGRNYPDELDFLRDCPEGGVYLYSRDPEQPGNAPGFQCYFLIRCSKHTQIGYNSIDGPVNPTALKTFRLR